MPEAAGEMVEDGEDGVDMDDQVRIAPTKYGTVRQDMLKQPFACDGRSRAPRAAPARLCDRNQAVRPAAAGRRRRCGSRTRDEAFDAVVLDLGLPDGDGNHLLRILRADGVRLPVLIISARDSLQERLKSFDLGADDYPIKPFNIPELPVRLRAIVRRSHATLEENLWTPVDIVLDENRMAVTRPGGGAAHLAVQRNIEIELHADGDGSVPLHLERMGSAVDNLISKCDQVFAPGWPHRGAPGAYRAHIPPCDRRPGTGHRAGVARQGIRPLLPGAGAGAVG